MVEIVDDEAEEGTALEIVEHGVRTFRAEGAGSRGTEVVGGIPGIEDGAKYG